MNARRAALRIFSGKIIYNRAMPGGLRTARHCVFTGGVVEENSICRADFLRKQPRGGKNPLRLTAFASSPEGGALFVLTGR